MAVPLAATSVVPNALLELLTGDSHDFAASLGNWTNSGGTLTRDTTYRLTNGVASAKLAVTAATQYMECPVPGVFKAGVTYWAVILVSLDDVAGRAADLTFGLIGTDSSAFSMDHFSASTGEYAGAKKNGSVGRYIAWAIRWKPSANRTGVKIRLTNGSAASFNWYIGLAVVSRASGTNDGPPTVWDADRAIVPALALGGSPKYAVLAPWTNGVNTDTGVVFTTYGEVQLKGFDKKQGVAIGDGSWYSWAEEGQASADKSSRGYNAAAGDNSVGWYLGELNNTHAQWYPYDNQYVQLRDAGTAGWSHSRNADAGAVDGKIEDSFQWAFYIPGTLATGTDQAAYWQVPAKCRIDEVRCHIVTQPTGASVIVDVNATGTTVFTTQANRPTIAVSTSDATSGAADGGTAIAKNSVLTIDIDQIGSTITGSDLVVFVRGRMVW